MHLLLTDRLTCPRCGPDFGLILLSGRTVERQVLQGSLGCPNCRDAFPVSEGFADLRAPPRGPLPAGLVGPPADIDEDEWARVAALLGVAHGPGTLALVGAPARHLGSWSDQEDLLVVGVDPDLRAWPEAPSTSRIAASPGLPFRSLALAGVCVDGRLGSEWLEEAARVVAPRRRVVVLEASPEAPEALVRVGLSIEAEEAGTVVAARG